MDKDSASIVKIIEHSLRKNWDLVALTDFGGMNLSYKDVAIGVEKLHILFENSGIKPGDRIAICGKNCANWAVVFVACLTGGYVAVPILHEFKPDNIHHLVMHSESKLLFVDDAIYLNIDNQAMGQELVGILSLTNFEVKYATDERVKETDAHINELFGKKYPSRFTANDISYPAEESEDTAVINYTSGSTGHSKGVVLSYRAIWSNIRYCLDHLNFLKAGDGVVCMLPLAHMYGMVIDLLHTFCRGCHCYFLTRLPSPKVIMSAFAEVRPKLIITVPIILEKIIRGKVFPMLEKPYMKILLKVPFVDEKLLAKIKQKIEQVFGGNLMEIIIGGAALNADVEAFLKRINFPYTVGYGMTECAPLLTYAPPAENREKSVGKIVDRMECRIDSPDPENVAGNLWVRGDNVMKGYYKNPEATKEVMPDDDGWMNTGDLCKMDEDGFIYICGRSKTMILGPSGQNIYPEEIEQKLNNLPYVNESLIVDRGGKLEALIYPDYDNAAAQGIDQAGLEKIMDDNIKTLNQSLEAYSKVSGYKLFEEEFEKTPKRSIKRFLYQP